MTSLRATVAVLVLVAHVPLIRAAQESTAPDLKTEQELRGLRTELLHAVEHGDRVALERILAPGFMFIHSTGVLESRQQFIENAAGSRRSREFDYSDETIRIYGGQTAIWTRRCVARGQPDRPTMVLRGTDVLVRQGGRWQWASVHSTRLPARPTAAPVAVEILKRFVGRITTAAAAP